MYIYLYLYLFWISNIFLWPHLPGEFGWRCSLNLCNGTLYSSHSSMVHRKKNMVVSHRIHVWICMVYLPTFTIKINYCKCRCIYIYIHHNMDQSWVLVSQPSRDHFPIAPSTLSTSSRLFLETTRCGSVKEWWGKDSLGLRRLMDM